MSSVFIKKNRKKGKHPRWNRKAYHIRHKRAKKTKMIRSSKWKLEYSNLFKQIEEIPYIVRINE